MNIQREAVRHPDRSLRCMHLQLGAFAGGLHRHHHAELTWVERGRGLRWVGDAVEPFGDGDLVLLGSELPHQWVSDGRRRSGSCLATVLQFAADWPARSGVPEWVPLQALLVRAAPWLVVGGGAHAAVTALLRRLPGSRAATQVALLAELLDVLNDAGTELRPISRSSLRKPPGGSSVPRRSERVIDWIRANLAQELRVEDAAAQAHVSPAAFARFFRREVGKSFTDYVNDARCSWAALRLAQTQQPVAEIAQACGYPTLSNFGEQFRRRHGCSPREFRQRLRV